MIQLCKVMVNLMKKLKKKRRLPSELHTRWGDSSISCPNEGSWNQWNQPLGFVANANPDTSREAQSYQSRRHIATGTTSSQNGGSLEGRRSQSLDKRDSTHCPSTIPKGYFDESIRHRNGRTRSPQTNSFGVAGASHGLLGGHDAAADGESCDEEDEELDTLGDPGGSNHHGYMYGDIPCHSERDSHDPHGDHAPISPPLSVTSRMRRISMNSAMTEDSMSVVGTASSRNTSFTAASSVSVPSVPVPSLPPDTSRHVFGRMACRMGARR